MYSGEACLSRGIEDSPRLAAASLRTDYLVDRLHEAELCGLFPVQALEFLNLVIGDQTQWPPSDLGTCLNTILTSEPSLEADPRYERLIGYWRQSGKG